MLLPINVFKAVVQSRRPNSVCGLSSGPSHGRTVGDECNIAMKHLLKVQRKGKLTTKLYSPLPVVVGKAVV